MNDPERAIDHALSALGKAELPEGLEARVLRHLAAQPIQTSSPRLWRRWQFAASPAAAAVAITLILVAHSPRATMPRHAELALPVTPRNVPIDHAHAPARAELRVKQVALPSPPPLAGHTPDLSFPAPPLPLTEQEKLLVQVARRGEPQAIVPPSLIALVKIPEHDLATFDRLFTMPEPAEPAPAAATPDTPPPEPLTPQSTIRSATPEPLE